MQRTLATGLMTLLAFPLLAAETNPATEVEAAAAALGNQTNYSWRTTVEFGNPSRFQPGPTEGKTEKGGYTTLTMTFNDATSQAVRKGTNGAVKTPDSDWQSLAEALKDDDNGGFNPTRFLARVVQNSKVPAVQAAELAGQTTDWKKDTNGISGVLTADGAKALLVFRPRGGNGDGEGPVASKAKASVTFWLADGRLVKYRFHVQGTVSFSGNDRDVDRTTTVEIKDVNTTRVEVPAGALKQMP